MTIDFKNNRIYHFNENFGPREHKPISCEFTQIEVLSNGHILVIEDYRYYENPGKSNLYCLNRKLEIEWHLPYHYDNATSIDNYVGFTTNGNRIFANTFSCYRVEIDTAKGEIKSVQFTK